jgi:transposase-like protein
MSLGRPRDASKEQQWRRRIQQWRRSGLSVRAFCDRHGLTQASFYLWRRELQHRDGAAVSFVPVEVAASETSRSESGIEIFLAGERRVRVAPGFDAVTLQRVVAVLEETRSC